MLRGSEERHTAQLQPIMGTPVLVPVPKKVTRSGGDKGGVGGKDEGIPTDYKPPVRWRQRKAERSVYMLYLNKITPQAVTHRFGEIMSDTDYNAEPDADDSDAPTAPGFAFSAGNPSSGGGEQTLSFLFTDIEKSGRLWRDYPAQMDAALVWHDELLRQTAQAHHGHVFKTMGDGAFLVFSNAGDALHAALDAQTALHNHFGDDGSNPLPLLVRMAIHTGAAQTRNGDFFGLTLSQTTRLLGAIHGGQIVLTQAAAALTRQALPDGVTLRELGQHHLRDFERPEPLFQACGDAFPCPPRPLRTDSLAPPHNLPRQISSFIGREKEIGQIKRLISASPLVTLTGPGGGGKTRLALQVAELLLPDFEHGAFFVDLSPLSDGTLIPQAVAQAIGVKEETDKTTTESLVACLRTRSLLLVLDNCEHLVEASAHFTDTLLRACADLRILATSRETLGLWGETVWPVPTLALPPIGGRPVSLQKLQTFEAVRLFCDRAQGQNGQFRITRSDAPHVLRLCRLLDGVPLALEIAASWAGVLTPAQIADRLGDRVKLLKAGGERVALPRQKTLRAAIDWSYNLLGVKEQALLRRLSVFAGGWTLESAEGVCSSNEANGPLSEDDVMDSLLLLAKKSLIVVDYQPSKNTGSGGETMLRYRMLETLRQYGQERLDNAGETNEATERHQAYFVEFAETAEPHLRGADQKLWLDKLEVDHDNFRAALGETEFLTPRLRIAGALGRFWLVRGYLTEGRRWLSVLCDAGDVAERKEEHPSLFAKAFNAAGYLAMTAGDFAEAHRCYAECLALHEKTGDRLGLAIVSSNLGSIASQEKNYEDAIAYFERSITIYREQAAETRLATVLSNSGALLIEIKKIEGAKAYLIEALTLQKKYDDSLSAANTLHNLAQAYRLEGFPDQARQHFCESLALRQSLGDKSKVAATLCALAHLEVSQQQWRRAVYLFAVSEKVRNEVAITQMQEDDEWLAKDVTVLRNHYGLQEFESLWTIGSALSLDDALNFAIENSSV